MDKRILKSGQADSVHALTMCSRLLRGLPETSRRRLQDSLEPACLEEGQVVYRPDAPVSHAVFPCDGLLSVAMRSDRKSIEVATIGSDGFFGLPLLFDAGSCPMTVVTLVAGRAARLSARAFSEAKREDQAFAFRLGSYAQAFSVMLGQAALCNALHAAEQRCAKWLLMAYDRLRRDEFPLTQASLAGVLGVRRPTVSEIAANIQEEGFIRYWRGRMTILDRQGLEALSCACYGIVRREFQRLIEPD